MILQEFKNPPNHYGEVSFFWWHGDPITKEKLSWILEQLKEKHICGIQINYCHSDQGGEQYGLTMESDPKPLSKEWWELVGWFIEEAKKYEMSVSLSDYTLGAPGQESYMDEVLKKHPEFIGQKLEYVDGEVVIRSIPCSANPMAKGIGEAVAKEFYGAFEEHFPNECGKGINFFFSDELNFNVAGNLWCSDFAEEFEKRKGYDICTKWEAIFKDIGDETPKIRLDYYDVIVALSEEAYFKPVYEWHEERGMIFGCDHGGRGKDIIEFGDYFRTMKWNQGPGNDQPRLEADIIKSKVSASIAHLYERERVWLEGFYSSGWDTSAADVADATFRNFGLGHNLLSLHGLYYSTHGSMWEWAPPCNHYHMPYWTEMGTLLLCTKRLSYLLSQGVHCCDVAIVYPVAAMEANKEQGEIATKTAFEAAEYLYKKGIDFDFIDFESIERATISEQKLVVAKENYQCIIIPSMQTVRHGMLQRLAEFSLQGGLVIILGEKPIASERYGKNDAEVLELTDIILQANEQVNHLQEMVEKIEAKFVRDFYTENTEESYVLHRKIEGKDLYYVYGVSRGQNMQFRAKGVPIILNPWSGERFQVKEYAFQKGITTVEMMLEKTEPLLLLFEEEQEAMPLPIFDTNYEEIITDEGIWTCEYIPTMDNQYGDYRLPASQEYLGVETRTVRYKTTQEDCSYISYDDSEWLSGTYSYAPYFWIYEGDETKEEQFVQMNTPLDLFKPYEFSMKYGIKGDAGYQGSYHGLKGKLSDDFLGLGKKRVTYEGSSSEYEGSNTYYLFSSFYQEEEEVVFAHAGKLKPDVIWVNHQVIKGKEVVLKKGLNVLLLKYTQSGRTHFVLQREGEFEQTIPLVTKWHENKTLLIPEAYPELAGKLCWYRFTSPPGMYAIKLKTKGECRVFADGKELFFDGEAYKSEYIYEKQAQIAVSIVQERGFYGAAAIQEPIGYLCEKGMIELGKTEEELGLADYSGGICYEKQMDFKEIKGRVGLELNHIENSVQVWVNHIHVTNLVAKPYRCDVTELLQVGKNHIRLVAHNTLHNHMKTIPTNFNQKRNSKKG